MGDKAYGSKKFIELVLSARLRPYIRLRKNFRRENEKFHIAQLFVLARFIFFNLSVLFFGVVDLSNTFSDIVSKKRAMG